MSDPLLSTCIAHKPQASIRSSYSDLAIFGLFFATSAILSAMIPFSSLVRGVLFPMCAFFLTFRRAVILNLLTFIPEVLSSAYKLDPISFVAILGITAMIIPGQTFGVWLFKRAQEHHVVRALTLYYLGTMLMSAIIIPPIGVGVLYLATYANILPYELPVTQPIVLPPQIVAQANTATSVLANLPPSLIIGVLMILPIAVFGLLILSFIVECYILRSIQRRIRGLPCTFPT